MLEFDLAVELMQREVTRARQVLITLVQRQPAKNTTAIYQEKVEVLDAFLNAANDILSRYHLVPLSEAELRGAEIQKEFFDQLDNLLKSEKWASQPLLQAVCQQMHKPYDLLLEQAGKKEPDLKESKAAALAETRASMMQVAISLYQADGYNMKKWAALLDMVGELSASRPVFQSEEDVQAVIREKDQKQKEGYAVVYVEPKAVLPIAKGQVAQDKSGHTLVFLKEGALRPENIIYFEHVTGRYVLQDGALIRQGDSSFL